MRPYTGQVSWLARAVFNTICRLDIADLHKLPRQGPIIVVANHVNFIEVPVIRANLHPREIYMLTKVETFKNPLLNILFEAWGGIPIQRGVVDRDALQTCLDVLAQGKILAIAPEGTRSGDGKLLPGKSGIVPVAVRSRAPILPIGFWGAEHYREDLKQFRRIPFHTRIGRMFIVDTRGEGLSKDVRQRITDEIMFRLAELLPEQYHGAYPHPEREVYRYLRDI